MLKVRAVKIVGTFNKWLHIIYYIIKKIVIIILDLYVILDN